MTTTRTTHSHYTTGMRATMDGNGRTAGFNGATYKMLAILPTGLTIEIYRKPEGTTQCEWFPKRPDFQQRAVREAILPHYEAAISTYASMFGKPEWVHGSAYEDGRKVGT